MNVLILGSVIILNLKNTLAITFLGCFDKVGEQPACSFRYFNENDTISFCFMPEKTFKSVSLHSYDLAKRPVQRAKDEITITLDDLLPYVWNYVSITYTIEPNDEFTSFRVYNYIVNTNTRREKVQFPLAQAQSSFMDLSFIGQWKGSRDFTEMNEKFGKSTNCNDETRPKLPVKSGVTAFTNDNQMENEDEPNYTTITIGFIVLGVVTLLILLVTAIILYKKVKRSREAGHAVDSGFEECHSESEHDTRAISLRSIESQRLK